MKIKLLDIAFSFFLDHFINASITLSCKNDVENNLHEQTKLKKDTLIQKCSIDQKDLFYSRNYHHK